MDKIRQILDNIEEAVVALDLRLFERGVDIEHRFNLVVIELLKMMGFLTTATTIYERSKEQIEIENVLKRFYRPQDLAAGGHIGVFMYRDIFARIRPPRAVGIVKIAPLDWVDLTPLQKKTIINEQENLRVFLEQFWCSMDIQSYYNFIPDKLENFELARKFIELARFNIHSSAAILTGGYDFRGAAQSSILAIELSFKAILAASGQAEIEIKRKCGHDIMLARAMAVQCNPAIESILPSYLFEGIPRLVDNRYGNDMICKRDTGSIAMIAQIVLANIVRTLTGRSYTDQIIE